MHSSSQRGLLRVSSQYSSCDGALPASPPISAQNSPVPPACTPFRRTKDLIKDQLPRKFDEVVFCPLTETQIEVYKRFIATQDVQLMVRKDEPCDCGALGCVLGFILANVNALLSIGGFF